MHLKRLEISGFKSFADSIKLDMEPGITAVVGPNGCGKSNIIDAIRWCLGEMSAKSLRSSMMMDVVFNGSGSRPPQNFAEVTLVFDNGDKRLPIDYSDVSITRRLFRSGESEYCINKTLCRLRDIRELFLDTGMGEDGYSSMEQGKVEWILQAKPEERRELFEEAAGVSKYRARREEALRKLEKVEIDLSRLADIIAVTQDQIKKLENAVNKAKTYQRIKEELKVMEVGDWLHQLSTSDEELAAIKTRLDTLHKQAEELNTQSHRINSELSEHRLSLTQLEEELLQANTRLNSVDSDIKIGEERVAQAKRRQEELESQRVHLHENITREEGRLEQVTKEHEGLLADVQALEQQAASFTQEFEQVRFVSDQASSALDTKKQTVKELREAILSRANQRHQWQQQLASLASEEARLGSQIEHQAAERERLMSAVNETQAEFQQKETLISEHRTLLQGKSTAAEQGAAQTADLETRQSDLRNKILSSTEELAKLDGQIHTIRDEQAEDPYLAGAQAVLSAGLPGISGPIAALIKTEDAHRDIVASALGEVLADVVADTTEDAEKAVAFVNEQNKGRVRVWVLNKLPERGASVIVSFGAASGAALLTHIQTEKKYQPLLQHLCSTSWLQGTTVYGAAFINGGVDPSLWKSHTLHRLPELETAKSGKQSLKNQLETELDEVSQKLSVALVQKETAFKEQEEARVRLELALEELARVAQRVERFQVEQEALNLDAARIESERQKALDRQKSAADELKKLQDSELDDHTQLEALQSELVSLQEQFAKASVELSAGEQKVKAHQEKWDWQKSILARNEQEAANIRQNMERYRQQTEETDVQIQTAKTTQDDTARAIETSLAERALAAEACAQIQSKRAALAETVQTLDQELSQSRSQLSTAQESLQNELLQENTLKNRVETTQQKLQDQYELTWETAKAQIQPQVADVETLERLKKRVANIGPINLAAPEEHAELVEKNTFMTTQHDDLIKAREDLKQVIAKINNTTRDHFKITFDKVRENFRALYGKLFQGGEADLRFTDENDILNTGIDIFCQPPGKKLLHISLLSGGEKALTAIALLFAFFQVRPSPLALLDEVDAPLDEANVLRYVDMIKIFSEKSQFLLISHNKRTMEAANNLYGVTMEELGVSKVLSARLQKKEAAAAAPAA